MICTISKAQLLFAEIEKKIQYLKTVKLVPVMLIR